MNARTVMVSSFSAAAVALGGCAHVNDLSDKVKDMNNYSVHTPLGGAVVLEVGGSSLSGVVDGPVTLGTDGKPTAPLSLKPGAVYTVAKQKTVTVVNGYVAELGNTAANLVGAAASVKVAVAMDKVGDAAQKGKLADQTNIGTNIDCSYANFAGASGGSAAGGCGDTVAGPYANQLNASGAGSNINTGTDGHAGNNVTPQQVVRPTTVVRPAAAASAPAVR